MHPLHSFDVYFSSPPLLLQVPFVSSQVQQDQAQPQPVRLPLDGPLRWPGPEMSSPLKPLSLANRYVPPVSCSAQGQLVLVRWEEAAKYEGKSLIQAVGGEWWDSGGVREIVCVCVKKGRGQHFLSLAANPSRLRLLLWGPSASTEKYKTRQQSPSLYGHHSSTLSELPVTLSSRFSPEIAVFAPKHLLWA